MFIIHFFESKNLLLTQLVDRVPAVDSDLRIKGRKGKISSVQQIDDKNIHVQIILENIHKNKLIEDKSKKKKR